MMPVRLTSPTVGLIPTMPLLLEGLTIEPSVSVPMATAQRLAAGATPDPAFPSDGMNLLPLLAANASSVRRTLFWRYKANAQRAVRDGDMKYLKILDNTFLFNVAEDPMERANLKERMPDVYNRLANQWLAWNQAMLPELDESGTGSNTAATWADHIGAPPASRTADNPGPPPSR